MSILVVCIDRIIQRNANKKDQIRYANKKKKKSKYLACIRYDMVSVIWYIFSKLDIVSQFRLITEVIDSILSVLFLD